MQTIEHEPPYVVGVMIGSLAEGSINRSLARALEKLAPEELRFEEIPIDEVPLYSWDYDDDYPASGRDLKRRIEEKDAILMVTPEYNRSIPGALKNAIDWASRPYGTNSFARKPTAVIGASPGNISTAVAQQHLRSVLSFCNAPQMNSPEGYIKMTEGLVADNGDVTDEGTREFLTEYLAAFRDHIMRVLTVMRQR